jgi:5'-phosphate synthase pdxT subunit
VEVSTLAYARHVAVGVRIDPEHRKIVAEMFECRADPTDRERVLAPKNQWEILILKRFARPLAQTSDHGQQRRKVTHATFIGVGAAAYDIAAVANFIAQLFDLSLESRESNRGWAEPTALRVSAKIEGSSNDVDHGNEYEAIPLASKLSLVPTGVLTIQGDFEKHVSMLAGLGVKSTEVRTVDDLAAVDRLIVPGGESSTVGLLLQKFGLGEALRQRAEAGMPIWGTCMGMILMANEIVGKPNQFTLQLLDIEVRRNAFGAQVNSFEDQVEVAGLSEPVTGVFIRAPIVTRCGPEVQVLSRYEGEVVAVRQGKLLGTSFHPELTDDTRLHEWFLGF